MSDTPLQIASATLQFLGVRSVVDDIFKVFRFVQSSREYGSDLSWLAGSARWELESLDQWGRYAGLRLYGSESMLAAEPMPTPEPSLLASPSARRRIVDILAGCRSAILELEQLLPTDIFRAPNTEAHATSPSNMQVPTVASADPALDALQYTEKITDNAAVVAAVGSYDSVGQSAPRLNHIFNCITQNKERIKELIYRIAESNRRLRDELPNPDVFYRWLASVFGELEPEELQQIKPSDTAFWRILNALIYEKRNSRLLQSNHVDNDFKLKLTCVPKMVKEQPPDNRRRGLAHSVVGRWVLVEWKRLMQTSTPGFRAGVKKRLDNLARCLHPGEISQRSDFHMMSCDGWFEDDHDSNWLGIVYRIPPSVDHKQEPRSLADIMNDPSFCPPSLGMRFKLAYQLAISLQEYHAINWFHKAFNSSNVLFFFDQTTEELCLEDPYVVGFGSSRRRKLDVTEGLDPDTDHYASLSQHPGVVNGFRAAYDVYALGCIMLELAHWKTLLQLRTEMAPEIDKQTWVEALEGMASDLGPKVGEIYEDAVGWCLCDAVTRIRDDSTKAERDRQDVAIMRQFRQNVGAPLASLHV